MMFGCYFTHHLDLYITPQATQPHKPTLLQLLTSVNIKKHRNEANAGQISTCFGS